MTFCSIPRNQLALQPVVLNERIMTYGYGRPSRTRVEQPAWTLNEKGMLALAVVLVVMGALWL